MLEASLNSNKFFCLDHWMEITGKLNKISKDAYYLYLDIDNKVLTFRKESKQASCIQNSIDASWIGKNVAILRTDIPQKPLVFRIID